LYDGAVKRAARLLTRLLAAAALCAVPAGAATDGLEAFRELAARVGPAPTESAVSALYALVDEEIVESLRGGGLFASPDFIQERLEGFNAAWGGARFRVAKPAPDHRGAVTVALYGLTGWVEGPGSVRIFTGTGAAATLARTITHPGTPEIFPWPATRGGVPQLGLAWVGSVDPAGHYPLRLEVWRLGGAGPTRVWSSADAYPDGLRVVDWRLGPGEIVVRYELRYPGWKPGCDGQAEQEDTIRRVPGSDTLASARRQIFNAWHRDLAREVMRFFAAMESGDRRALTELVPDAALRARLPGGLVPEPLCDVASPDSPSTVVVAATDERAAHRTNARSPWSLWWSRQPRGWRLAGAAPVLQ
jgi:hypothetical protein